MPDKISQAWQQIQREWQANRRLQLAVLVALVIAVIGLHLRLDDWRAGHHEDARRARAALHDLQGVAAENTWPERAQAAAQALQQTRQLLWQAPSEGAAQAEIRDRLQAEARRHGVELERTTVQVGSVPRGLRAVPVRAELRGIYRPGQWQAFIAALDAQRPALILESETVDRSNPRRHSFRLTITAWYELTNEAAP